MPKTARREEAFMSKEIDRDPARRLYADWNEPARYERWLMLDRAGWAWKWLRRNPDYIALAGKHARLVRADRRDARVRVITVSDTEDASAWGLYFCRSPCSSGDRRPHFLARRLGRIGARRGDLVAAAQRRRHL
jgi:hypothetical protein